MKLRDILQQAKLIKAREKAREVGFVFPDDATPIEMLRATGIDLPDNPTIADFRRAAAQIGQNAKEVQNTEHRWTDEQWREISRAIEKLKETSAVTSQQDQTP